MAITEASYKNCGLGFVAEGRRGKGKEPSRRCLDPLDALPLADAAFSSCRWCFSWPILAHGLLGWADGVEWAWVQPDEWGQRGLVGPHCRGC